MKFTERELTGADADKVFALCTGNPLFFEHCSPPPTRETVLEDMAALPPGMGKESKFFLGFFDGDLLAAVTDLILGYPKADTAFIGLFMMAAEYQGRGVGSEIISGLLGKLGKKGYHTARLAYMKSNPQSRAFWLKNGFLEAGERYEMNGCKTVVLAKSI